MTRKEALEALKYIETEKYGNPAYDAKIKLTGLIHIHFDMVKRGEKLRKVKGQLRQTVKTAKRFVEMNDDVDACLLNGFKDLKLAVKATEAL